MRRIVLLIVTLTAVAACADEPEPEAAESTATSEGLAQKAIAACLGGNVDPAIARLDSALAAGPVVDGYAVRAGCLRQRFARDAARADLDSALVDLDRALAEPPSEQIPPASLWSQRAFVLLAVSPDSLGAALASFDRAVDADPTGRIYRLDRSTARAMAGDRDGALADLAALDSAAQADSSLAAALRQRREALGVEP